MSDVAVAHAQLQHKEYARPQSGHGDRMVDGKSHEDGIFFCQERCDCHLCSGFCLCDGYRFWCDIDYVLVSHVGGAGDEK